ncbi:MAG: hypothetical protein C5B52_11025 [Bacteroidetes bacterium]|nr:MAG: hypothetical protein C5B52_11025 [Bacteroidota bacterium]
MNQSPFISICVPAYKRIEFLERLFHSISTQTYRDFEVIVTDDSPDSSVANLCLSYTNQFPLKHYKNLKQLGTPENWNEAIRKANGSWIKLMHDDDWFAEPLALELFANYVKKNPQTSFVFSAYRNVYLDENREADVFPIAGRLKLAKENPSTLISNNIIGPPSVTMHRNDGTYFYDNNLKWVVDIEFYIRYLSTHQPEYVDRILVNVGMGREQVTQESFRVREVEIPEYFYLFNKIGFDKLKSILVYDAWWRLMRNLNIRNVKEISDAGYTGNLPEVIRSMIKWQSFFPSQLLKLGFFSKILMLKNYFFNRIFKKNFTQRR